MQIKSDFVTNSSSTCYVVYIPENYEPNDEELQKAINEAIEWYGDDPEEEITVESIREKIMTGIDSLQEGEDVYADEYDSEFSISEFSILSSVLDKFNVASVEIPSDGMYIITGVNNKKIMEILVNNSSIEFIKNKYDEKK